MRIPVLQKVPFSGLRLLCVSWYSFPAVAKSTAGRRNPCLTMATPDAPCVFFCVCALMHPFNTQWPFRHCGYLVMVAQAGQLSGWPVLIVTGIPTPVWATTHECRNSGGSCNQLTMEAAVMATTLTLPHPQFVFVFAAVRRADRKRRICMLSTVTGDERAARLSLVRDYILTFAGRLPVTEVCA
ncbi:MULTISPECIES: host cell division inhibitor Icd-like protein [Citrobacter]|uniref:host cell division inhibitor Icd-like protein n=1 Tax=Citrobacter TaxID=544 RepID=UPI00136313B7|nr:MULTISPECIES: host cell division inhibitor Icd-like protein [Citrobacter]MDT7448592.1 host cell division inhibitor Icd-like protein [Citrobacter freundii]QHI84187.1 host cell division inhibitor Icd-like protein [Citrobacter sp. LUTT5]